MINLEIPNKLKPLIEQAHVVGSAVFRPISRKYDRAEHSYPKELDMLAAVMDGFSEAGAGGGVSNVKQGSRDKSDKTVKNGANMSTVLGMVELCWGDIGLALSIPRQGLGNAAVAAVATPEQKAVAQQANIAAGCTGCHLEGYLGASTAPRLAGQQPVYLE